MRPTQFMQVPKTMFTLDARALVPGNWIKIVLLSDTGTPKYCLVPELCSVSEF